MPKNMLVDEDWVARDTYKRFKLTDNLLRKVPLGICQACSGYNKYDKLVFKAFSGLYRLQYHCSDNHEIYPIGSVFNIEIKDNMMVFEEHEEDMS